MNAKFILEQLLRQAGSARSGSDARKGGFDAKSMLKSGALGLLLGSRRGRMLSGAALKYGLMLEAGKLAWRAWQGYQQHQRDSGRPTAAAPEGTPFEQLDPAAQERRSAVLLKTMIAAANADGHIDAAERQQLLARIDELGADEELRAWISDGMDAPADIAALAREADSQETAMEMYLAAVSMVDIDDPQERAWLDRFSQALGLEPKMAQELERQARAEG